MIDSEKLTRWYDFQAPFYARWRNADRELVDRVLALLPESTELRVLDAGCGTGLFTVGLGESRPTWRLDGIDASDGMLRVARAAAERSSVSNATFRRGDVAALPWADASFDVVVAAGLLPNLNEWGGALGEFRRVLKAGGRLIVVEVDRAAMTRTRRVFFRTMIFGYRTVSWFLRRFRFAEGWNIEASTVDPDRLAREVASAGFGVRGRHGVGSSFVLDLEKA